MEDKLEKLKKENNLQDILLKDKEDLSVDNTKKYLLYAASLILIFLIVLILLKMFNSSNISPSESLVETKESIEHISKDVQDSTLDTEEKSGLFKEEPIIDETSETDLKFEEMVRKLKQQDAQENQDITPSVPKEEIVKVIEEKVDIKKDESVINKIKEVTSEPVKRVQESIDKLKPSSSTPTVEPIAKSTITLDKPKEEVVVSTKKEYTPSPLPISSLSGYFIQVGATSKSFPDKRFLNKIKSSGYDYIVHKVTIKGQDIKKVLIGPYSSRSEARGDLGAIQSKINPSAYIYRIK